MNRLRSRAEATVARRLGLDGASLTTKPNTDTNNPSTPSPSPSSSLGPSSSPSLSLSSVHLLEKLLLRRLSLLSSLPLSVYRGIEEVLEVVEVEWSSMQQQSQIPSQTPSQQAVPPTKKRSRSVTASTASNQVPLSRPRNSGRATSAVGQLPLPPHAVGCRLVNSHSHLYYS